MSSDVISAVCCRRSISTRGPGTFGGISYRNRRRTGQRTSSCSQTSRRSYRLHPVESLLLSHGNAARLPSFFPQWTRVHDIGGEETLLSLHHSGHCTAWLLFTLNLLACIPIVCQHLLSHSTSPMDPRHHTPFLVLSPWSSYQT
jgi:hypothetical protein